MNTLSPQRRRTVVLATLAGAGTIVAADIGNGGHAARRGRAGLAAASLAGAVDAVSAAVVYIKVIKSAQPALTS